MKWKFYQKGNKYKRKLVPDAEDYIGIMIVLLIALCVTIRVFVKGGL